VPDISEIWAALILVITGAAAYWNQKRLDHKTHLLELRRSLYQQYLEALVELGVKEWEQLERKDESLKLDQEISSLRAKAWMAASKLTVVASSQVLDPLSRFEKERADSSFDEEATSASNLLRAMRNDVFDRDDADIDLLLEAFPIQYRSPTGACVDFK
jgi:hypothetical protein